MARCATICCAFRSYAERAENERTTWGLEAIVVAPLSRRGIAAHIPAAAAASNSVLRGSAVWAQPETGRTFGGEVVWVKSGGWASTGSSKKCGSHNAVGSTLVTCGGCQGRNRRQLWEPFAINRYALRLHHSIPANPTQTRHYANRLGQISTAPIIRCPAHRLFSGLWKSCCRCALSEPSALPGQP